MKKKIYFIGIGGIGMSSLAQYYIKNGWQVLGSDLSESEITNALKKMGVKIFIGEDSKRIKKDFDKVVITPAVTKNNKEFKQAKKLGLCIQTYPEALGELTKEKFTIAIAGSHGKSSTTAMMALILIEAGLDPTVIVGTKLKEFDNSNFRAGKSKYLLIEACEYDDSFLNYSPDIAVITNIDEEHLDYFKNLKGVINSFQEFVKKLSKNGWLILNKDDENSRKIKGLNIKKMGFSLAQDEAIKLKKVLKLPGDYNVYNALAALSVARVLRISDKVSFQALSKFKGTWRRFEIEEKSINNKKFTYISDYAHHPNEISAMLTGAREKYPDEKIWCIFQPHQYQRTYFLLKKFVSTFKEAPIDKLILIPIYSVSGRESAKIKSKISSMKLVEKINKKSSKKEVIYKASLKAVAEYLKKETKGGEVIIAMGAGDIYNLKNLI